MCKEAKLVSISRGFGGDNAYYESHFAQEKESIVVAVGWALLCPFLTTVTIDGIKAAEFTDKRYVQPAEALARLGYAVHGTVDFAASQLPISEATPPEAVSVKGKLS